MQTIFRYLRNPAIMMALLTAGTAMGMASFPGSALAASCDASPGPGVDWTDCRKRNLILEGSDFSGAMLSGADFSSTDLRNSNMGEAVFSKSTLGRAMLDSSQAKGANFEKALGYRTSFVNTDLEEAIFTKSEMQRADFTDANLLNADFEKSELGRVIFTRAVITGTVFSFANLARADFREAEFEGPLDFNGAYLYRTRFEGVDLSNAKGMEQWQLDQSCGDDTTTLPANLARPAGWPCEEE